MSPPLLPLGKLLGQEGAAGLLRSFLGRPGPVPPLLFHGPPGVGKRTAALAFASGLVCRKPGEQGGCGHCPGCQRIADAGQVTLLRAGSSGQDAAMTYPDAGLVTIPQGKTRLLVAQARDIALSMSLQPFELPRRIYIVDPADSLTLAAANALLKVLEEPPEFGVLILITSAPWALPVTLRSRMIPVRFRPLPQEAVIRILIAEGTDPEEARLRSARARGRLDRARVLDPQAEQQRLMAWGGILGGLAAPATAAQAAVLAGETFGASAEEAQAGLELLLALLRDGAALSVQAPCLTLDEAQGASLAPSLMTLLGPTLERASLVERLRREITVFNRNPRLAVEGAALALAGILEPSQLPPLG